jgi:hypothetical protein
MPNNARGVNRDISENGTAWDQIRRERKVRKSTYVILSLTDPGRPDLRGFVVNDSAPSEVLLTTNDE